MDHSGVNGVYFGSGGNKLLGRLFLAPGEGPKPTAVWLHGIPGIEQNHDLALHFRNIGWNSLIFHYRGCWGSTGGYDLTTIPDDVSAALDFLESGAYPQIDPNRILLAGHSLGGWAAVMAGAQDPRPKGIISIGGLLMPEWVPMVQEYTELSFIPWLTDVNSEQLLAQWTVMNGKKRPSDLVNTLNRPLLLVHGSNDTSVGPSHSKKLAELAPDVDVTLNVVDGADHGFSWHRSQLIGLIEGWVKAKGLG